MTNRLSFFSLLLLCVLTGCGIANGEDLPTRAVLPTDAPLGQQVTVAPPNDLEAVQLLDYWVTASSLLSPSKTRDIWQFVGTRGDEITLRVIGYNIEPTMTLQDPNGEILMDGTDIQMELPEDGRYTVQVTLGTTGDGSYDIGLGYADRPNPNSYTPTPRPQLVGVPTPTPPYEDLGSFVGRMQENTPTGSILSENVAAHVYTFEGTPGEIVNIRMERVSGDVDPFLTIFSPDGDVMAMDGNTGASRNAELRNIKLLEDGVYSVQATGTDNTYGTYSLTLTRGGIPLPTEAPLSPDPTETRIPLIPTLAPAMNGNRLQSNSPVVGRLEEGDYAQFSIYAVAGEIFTIGVKPVGETGLRAQIEMYSPEGDLVLFTNASESGTDGSTLIPAVIAPITGAYIVLLGGENNGGGDYVLSYGTGYTAETIVRGSPPPNTRAEGNLTRGGVLDEWHVNLNVNDVINIAVSNAGGDFDPYVEIRTWDGELLAGDDNSGGDSTALIQSVQIPTTDTYRIHVRDATPDQNIGQYTLIWRYINTAPSPTPIPPFSTLMSLDDRLEADNYQFYVFYGLAGQSVRIRVEPKPGEQLDPVAVLLDPNGNQIAQADDSYGTLNPVIEVALTQDGPYTVRVNGYLSSGMFDLYVEQLF